jgi:tetraacyldisaccharide 4'-kinase
MVNQWVLKLLLLPVAVLYGIGVTLRNGLYNSGILKGSVFSLPVISIGNLTVGGTGKTPHTEYLIRMLYAYLHVAVLSRGYKRKTSGYLEVTPGHDATQVGDEPLQYKRKYPSVTVAVAESRSLAIPQVIQAHPEINLVLLDDGFQHREVTPGLNILLTEYNRLYTRDWFLPFGRLREWRDEAKRADIIIITKCPATLTRRELDDLTKEVVRGPGQKVFFSRYIYGHPYRMYGVQDRLPLHKDLTVLVVVAIAGTEYLLEYVDEACREVRLLEYNDHHSFSNFDIGDIERHFNALPGDHKIILTTEKDAMRLDGHRDLLLRLGLPIYILPVAVSFLGDAAPDFDQVVKDWLLNFKR